MKTILVPTDFSDCAMHAFDYACHIAKKTRGKIILLHIIESPDGSSLPPIENLLKGGSSSDKVPFMMALLKKTKAKMKKLLSSSSNKSVKVIDMIETGEVSAAINRSAKKHKANLIVMGTHGASGFKEFLIGSNAVHVVRDAEIPVISIRNSFKKNKIENIVFATDFSEETKLVFPYVKTFAKLFSAKIHVVKIADDVREEKAASEEGRKFKKENREGNLSVSILHNFSSKEEGIMRFSEMINSDLVALGTHGRHGLARFFKGSVAGRVVNHLSSPVLSINLHKKLLALKKPFKQENIREVKKQNESMPPVQIASL